MHHPQVVQSPIFNSCLKVDIDCHNRLQIVSKLSLQLSFRELHNSLVGDQVDGCIKKARYADNNITISYCTLRSLMPPQFKTNSSRYKFMCGCECFISDKSIHSHYYHGVIRILKTQRSNPTLSKQKVLGEKLHI